MRLSSSGENKLGFQSIFAWKQRYKDNLVIYLSWRVMMKLDRAVCHEDKVSRFAQRQQRVALIFCVLRSLSFISVAVMVLVLSWS